MPLQIRDPKYNILDVVFHITPDSPQGIVLDVKYSFYARQFEYLVAFGTGASLAYYEHELVKTKQF